MTKIEEVAMAIWRSWAGPEAEWESLSAEAKQLLLASARAAIEALREPSDFLKAKARLGIADVAAVHDYIDAILAEKPE